MKKIFSLFSVLLITVCSVFCCAPVTVSALSSQSIPEVNINCVLNKDGTVRVTEDWTVEYIEASNTFERQIDIYGGTDGQMTLIQKYDEIKDVSVKIDGVSVREAPEGVNTYVFQKSADGKSYDIIIYSPSAQTTKKYTISYTVTGAIKSKGSKAVFASLIIGETFKYTSNNVTVNVVVPEDIDSSDIISQGDINGNTVSFNSKRVYNVMWVEVSAPKKAFDDGALASYSSAAETFGRIKKALIKILPWLIAVIAAAAIVLFVLLPDKLLRRPLEKNAKKLASEDSSSSLTKLPEGITACHAYKMLTPYSRLNPKSTSKKVPMLFALAVLECIEKGYIKPEDGAFIVGTPEDAPDYMNSVLNFIKSFCVKKNNRLIIDASFGERLRAECSAHYDMITNYLIAFYSLIPSAKGKFFRNDKNKELYENAYVLKLNILKNKEKKTYSDYLNGVLQGKKTSDAEIFAFMFTSLSADKLFKSGKGDCVSAISDAVCEMYNAFIKSK